MMHLYWTLKNFKENFKENFFLNLKNFREKHDGQLSKESIKTLEVLSWSFRMIWSSQKNDYSFSTSKVNKIEEEDMIK